MNLRIDENVICYTLQLSPCLFWGGIRGKGEKNYNESHILLKSLRIFSEMMCIIYQKKNPHTQMAYFQKGNVACNANDIWVCVHP